MKGAHLLSLALPAAACVGLEESATFVAAPAPSTSSPSGLPVLDLPPVIIFLPSLSHPIPPPSIRRASTPPRRRRRISGEMSRFGRSGPPPIRDTYSLLVLNITFRTTADDLFPLFDKYGEVVDIYIPRDRRTGDSRGFAFVRYKYEDEAQKAVDRLDGKLVDGREIMVQFAKYGPNAERINKGRIVESVPRSRGRSRSRSPRRRNRDDYRDDYRDRDYRRRSRSRSRDRYTRDRYRERDYRRRSRSHSYSPDDYKKHGRDSLSPARRSPSRSRSRSYSPDGDKRRGRDSLSPVSRSPSRSPPRKASPSPEKSPVRRNDDRSPRSPSPST